jgi:pimeloyl-ACP methyl ester carboxylesterase
MSPGSWGLTFTLAVGLLGCAHVSGVAPPGASSPERAAWVAGAAGRLHVSDGGSGEPAVVLVHGLGGDLEVWRAQLDHLRAGGRRAVAYDQRGHGASDKARDGVYTIEALAEDLEAIRRGLGLRKMVLVGHSMSGEVLTTYAGTHPDSVAGLLYLDAEGDTHAYPAAEVSAYAAQVNAPGLDAAGRRAKFEKDLAPARLSTREQVLAALDRIDPPAFGKLFDDMLRFRDARARMAPYHGPAAAIEVEGNQEPDMAAVVLGLPRTTVPGVSHWLQLDDPAAVNRGLDAFLASLGGGS